jgi:hypothetical protein
VPAPLTAQPEPASALPTPPAAQPAPAPAQTAEFPAVSRRQPRRGLWAIGAIGVLAIAAVTGLVFWPSSHAGGGPKRHHPSASPQAVVRAYIRDINKRDYRAAWRLGGDNISSSYKQFVAGFQLTKHVVITHLVVRGTTVHVRTLASETTGPVQTYALTYVVQNGKIVLGTQRLISTSP